MRLINTINGFSGCARVYHDAEFEEFVVKFKDADGREHPGADYHTGDRQDAISTARLMTADKEALAA